jgi:hypothetical protein
MKSCVLCGQGYTDDRLALNEAQATIDAQISIIHKLQDQAVIAFIAGVAVAGLIAFATYGYLPTKETSDGPSTSPQRVRSTVEMGVDRGR